MALFRSSGKAEALRRAVAREWKSKEEQSALLHELGGYRDLRADELGPLLATSDPLLRSFAEHQLRERLDPRSLALILEGLDKKTSRTQSQLLNALVRARPDLAVPQVQRLVQDADKDLALRAMEALAELPLAQVGAEFVRLLAHARKDIRHLALVKVAESGPMLDDPAIARAVAGMAEDEDERIRLQVLDLVGRLAPGDAVRLVLERLKDPSPSVQQIAVRMMGETLARMESSSEAEDQLLALLADGSEAIRTGVIEIIMQRPDKDRILKKLLLFCKSLIGWVRDRTLATLRNHAHELTQPVIRLMSDPDEDVRSMALVVGATLESPEATPHIVRLLNDPDWWLRMTAAETLGKIADPRAIPALVLGLDDPDTALACIEALSRMRDERVLTPIALALQGPQIEVRIEALEALRRVGDARVAPLLELVTQQDPSAAVQRRAAEVLAELTDAGRAASAQSKAQSTGEHTSVTLRPIEELLVRTRTMGGSDLHVVVDAPPTVRVHGELVELEGRPYDARSSAAALIPILSASQQEVLQTRKQLDFCHMIPGVGRYRANVYVERKGLAASFRVIPNTVPTFKELGIPPHLADIVNYHQGLIVVAGPSGSGKSTTLAAFVNLFNERRLSHILLLEDPIEFVHSAKGCLINQREVGKHTRGFAQALRGALRQDPDVIVVGDMRDQETVKLAIEASETGHLVIGTMNTTSAPKTVDRIIDAFPVSEQAQIRTMLSETLKIAISQNLIPNADGTGRVGCFEVLMGTLGVRNLIRDSKTYQLVGQMQIGEHHGHITVDGALARLLDARQITAEQAWTRAHNKELFEARVTPAFLAGRAGR